MAGRPTSGAGSKPFVASAEAEDSSTPIQKPGESKVPSPKGHAFGFYARQKGMTVAAYKASVNFSPGKSAAGKKKKPTTTSTTTPKS